VSKEKTMPDLHPQHIPAPEIQPPPFEIEDGLHVGCGGQVVIGLDGIRAECTTCRVTETWEQAARRLRDTLNQAYDRLETPRAFYPRHLTIA